MKPMPSPACNCDLEDQTSRTCTAVTPLQQTARQIVRLNSSLAAHQTLWQQGGTEEDSHSHLADWTVSEAAIKGKKNKMSVTTVLLTLSHTFPIMRNH